MSEKTNCVSCTPEPQELDNLGPGCYVQIKENDNYFWVEITEKINNEFSGVLHCELGETNCNPTDTNLTKTKFNKNQIVNLGCDNYCWC